MINENMQQQTIWEYANWLYLSHRLTTEEYLKLKEYIIGMEIEAELSTQTGGC